MTPAHRHFWISAAILAAMIPLSPALSSHQRSVPLRRPLAELDYDIGTWRGHDQQITDRVRSLLHSADVLLRRYTDAQGQAVDLYVSYFPHQQQGQASHSPKNCLPGSGWQPLRLGHAPYPLGGEGAGAINEALFEKDGHRLLVFYWYRERDRIVASEYWMKWHLMWDAITRNRTDGALIRISTPADDSLDTARKRALAFMHAAIPRLSDFLPE